MHANFKGLVLAAGFGTRLRPLTNHYAKPLVPFLGATPLELALWRLGASGVKDVAINSHYFPEQIASFVDENRHDLNIKLSYEPKILGTGGALNPLLPWLGDDSLIVINGDVVSTVNIQDLIETHLHGKAVATMALLPSVIPGESSVFHQNGAVHSISKIPVSNGSRAGNFACVQILSPEFLKLLPENGTFDIISQGYLPALQRRMTICASIHDGYWFDLGTPETYWAAIHQLLKRPALVEALGIRACRALNGRATTMTLDGVFIDSRSTVDATATVGPAVVVESNCSISANALVSESVLLPGASIAPGEVIHQMIVGPKIRHQLSVSV